jgi:hypothetical protein
MLVAVEEARQQLLALVEQVAVALVVMVIIMVLLVRLILAVVVEAHEEITILLDKALLVAQAL